MRHQLIMARSLSNASSAVGGARNDVAGSFGANTGTSATEDGGAGTALTGSGGTMPLHTIGLGPINDSSVNRSRGPGWRARSKIETGAAAGAPKGAAVGRAKSRSAKRTLPIEDDIFDATD